MKSRKSQGALEFLMVYGWAVMLGLFAIGFLVYLDVFNPGKFSKDHCTLEAGIACLEHKVTSAVIQVKVENLMGKRMNNVVAYVGECGNSGAAVTITQRSFQVFSIACSAPLIGTKYKGNFNITYEFEDSSIQKTAAGEIVSRIS